MELIEGPFPRIHQRIVLPCLRDHHQDGMGQRAAGANKQFERVVEHRRVAAVGLDDGQNLLDVIAEQGRGELLLPRMHPVDIAAQRVDFAVMA
jgi:hypothetical protein